MTITNTENDSTIKLSDFFKDNKNEWCKGANAKTVTDKDCFAEDFFAKKFCLMGAMSRIIGDYAFKHPDYKTLLVACKKEFNSDTIVNVNDNILSSKKELILFLQKYKL